MLRDAFDRAVTNVRISLTPACNFSCFYCHREGYSPRDPGLMTPGEIRRIVEVMGRFGVSAVKFTGGEPTLRPDLEEIIREVASINSVRDLSLVTNGSLLVGRVGRLADAGLDRINVSLPSLRRERFRLITGVDALDRVLAGIREASRAGFRQVKINRVVLRGINDDEIDDLIDFARKVGAIVQLIQLEDPDPNSDLVRRYGVGLEDITSELDLQGRLIYRREGMHNRPVYDVGGVRVEVVGPMGNSDFCFHCTRIRITHDGRFKPCLFRDDGYVDFLSMMREGASDDVLAAAFIRAVSLRIPYFGWIVGGPAEV